MENPFKTTERGLVKTHCKINECAELLSCHRNTVVNYLEKGIFTKIKPNGGRHVYIALDEINRFLSGENMTVSTEKVEKPKRKIRRKRKKTVKIDINAERFTYSVNDKAREEIDKSYGKVEPTQEEREKKVARLKASKFISKPKKRFRKKSKSDSNYEKQPDFEKKQLMDKRIKEKRAKRELERKSEYPSMTKRSEQRVYRGVKMGSSSNINVDKRVYGARGKNSTQKMPKGRR
jgi:hypothetical protein